MKELIGGETLRKEFRADHLSISNDEASSGFAREGEVSHASNGDWISDSEQDGGYERKAN